MKGARTQNVAAIPTVTAPDAEAIARIGAEAAFAAACRRLGTWERWLQQRQLELTSIAAPTGFEALRAEWVCRQWRELGLEAEVDEAGNVVAHRPGADSRAGADARAGAEPRRGALAIAAHLDTAFPAGTHVRTQRHGGKLWGPGICDNGAGLVALLALARCLQEFELPTRAPVLFVATVGEEGEGDLKGMRHLFRPHGPWGRRIAWTLVLDGPGCRHITAAALPSLRLRAVFTGPGGHSWSDVGRASATHAAVRTAAGLLAQVRPEPGELACNLGFMQGGGAVNAIAATAELKFDLRARDPQRLQGLEQALRRALALGVEQENQAALSGRVTARLESLGARPGGALAPDAPLLRVVRQVDALLGIPSQLQCASTDANIPIAQNRQAVRLGAGGEAGGIHTLEEWFDPVGRTLALQRLLWLVWALSGVEAPPARRGRPRLA